MNPLLAMLGGAVSGAVGAGPQMKLEELTAANPILYRWPDGWWIERISCPRISMVDFVMFDADGEMVSSIRLFMETEQVVSDADTRDQPVGHPHAGYDGEVYRERWLPFALDMVLMPNDSIQGKWGILKAPFWLKSSVYERAENPGLEKQIQRAVKDAMSAGDYAILNVKLREIEDFAKHVFSDYPSVLDQGFTWFILGKNYDERVHFMYRLDDKVWYMMNLDGYAIEKGPTLRSTLHGAFDDRGAFRDEKHEDAWQEVFLEYGEPTIELDLEPYHLLSKTSPLIWPEKLFQSWWKAQVPRALKGTL